MLAGDVEAYYDTAEKKRKKMVNLHRGKYEVGGWWEGSHVCFLCMKGLQGHTQNVVPSVCSKRGENIL